MLKNKKINSDLEMILVDLMTVIKNDAQLSAEKKKELLNMPVNEILNCLPRQVVKNTDSTFRKRQYKDLSYAQAPTLNERDEVEVLLYLSGYEARIVELFRCLSFRQCIQISKKDLSEILEVSKDTVKRSMRSLMQKNVLQIVVPAQKNRPAVYKLNPVISRSGKTFTKQEDVNALKTTLAQENRCFKEKYVLETIASEDEKGHTFQFVKVQPKK